MDFKKLREELAQFIETQVEGGDELQEILDGTWTGESGNTLADVIIPRIGELSVEQLINILNNSSELEQENSLFPSGFNAAKFGVYPAKLADALSQSKVQETLTDLYNIYYARRSEDVYKEAIPVWKNAIMTYTNNTLDVLTPAGDTYEDAYYDSQIFDVLSKKHKDLYDFLMELVRTEKPELADAIEEQM